MRYLSRFFERVLISTISLVAAFTTLIIFLSIILWFMLADSPIEVEHSSVLFINLNKPLVERSNPDNFSGALDNPLTPSIDGLGILDLKKTLAQAKEDENIKGIFLNIGFVSGGLASFEEVRNSLIDFKKSKKFIVVYAEFLTEKSYYLASIADKIYLNPAGAIEFNGFSSERTFYVNALEKLEIKPEIFRVGDYKSAVEPFMLEQMSEASRLQTMAYLENIYGYMLKNIAQSQKLDAKKLRLIADSLKVRNPEDAKKYKLITDIGYYDQAKTYIKKQLKLEKDKDVPFISLGEYQQYQAQQNISLGEDDSPKIAVIIANGEIISGQGSENLIGSEKISQTLRKVRKDKNVKAVILRINSPGGSALASDVMWREIILTSQEKPIIASMSDVAASGGYYMAMACDTIVAYPNTITGSIGIFGILLDTHDFFENKLGITTDRVNTGAFSDLGNPNRPMTDQERAFFQEMVEEGYEMFTSKAAQGRGMSLENLKKIASGRVWSGIEAKKNGLVDVLGDFETAIQIAAQKANLKEGEYLIQYLPEQEDLFEKVLRGFQTSLRTSLIPELLELPLFLQTPWQKHAKNDWIQARLPYDLVID